MKKKNLFKGNSKYDFLRNITNDEASSIKGGTYIDDNHINTIEPPSTPSNVTIDPPTPPVVITPPTPPSPPAFISSPRIVL